jgi:hypothetical protein
MAPMSLPDAFPTEFTLHKRVPSLQHNPSTPSPYQCQFLCNKYQSLALSALVWIWVFFIPVLTIHVMGKLLIFLTKTCQFSLLWSILGTLYRSLSCIHHTTLLPCLSFCLLFLSQSRTFSSSLGFLNLLMLEEVLGVDLPNRRGTSKYSLLTTSVNPITPLSMGSEGNHNYPNPPI